MGIYSRIRKKQNAALVVARKISRKLPDWRKPLRSLFRVKPFSVSASIGIRYQSMLGEFTAAGNRKE